MACRKLREAGVNPALGFVLGTAGLVLISEYMFRRSEFAGYFLLLIASGLFLKLAEKSRNEFLQVAFGDRKTRTIRVVENFIASSPFLVILLWKQEWAASGALLVMALILAVFSFKTNVSLTIPTPFSAKPFEFTTGFRKSFYLFPCVYALTAIAVSVSNLNLGFFSLLSVFLIASSYYTKPEDEYYIWIYAESPRTFLLKKMKSAAVNVFVIGFPVLTALIIFHPDKSGYTLLFYLIGQVFLWTVLLAKYSVYPKEMNLPEVALLMVSVPFPPILLALLPYFYNKSVQKLKVLLND